MIETPPRRNRIARVASFLQQGRVHTTLAAVTSCELQFCPSSMQSPELPNVQTP
jgi:hypothetical protein